ncbi:MAG: hypothetical protein ACRDZ4_18305 [Egibacteraceae bacterium]
MHAGDEGRGFWPWIEAGDEATCLDALAALQRAGVLPTRHRAWLAPAARQGVGAPLGAALPWAAWAMRIGEGTRLPIGVGTLAVAVTALNARRTAASEEANGALDAGLCSYEHAVPDDATRWRLVARVLERATGGRAPLTDQIASWLVGLGAYPVASAPKNPPLGAAASQLSEQSPCLRASCGVREAVVLWTLPALLAGGDLVAWSRFGQAVAEPITLLGDLARLWLDPDARDLRDAALTPLVEAWLFPPPLRAALLGAYAGERTSAVRHAEVRGLLASEPYRARLESVARRALARAEDRLPSGETSALHAAAVEFLDALAQSFRRFDALMAFRALMDLRPARPDHALRDAATTDARMAVAYLAEHAPWPGSWGVHRFGVFGSTDQPVGQWFVRGVILRALLELGQDAHGEVARLLGEIPPGELRYYSHWREIPPDADSLGLMLELVAATGTARDRAETWTALLLANTDEDGVAPVYFSRDPAGRPTTSSGKAWPGGDCNAVRLNLLCGLLAFDAARFDEVIQANTACVLECTDEAVVAGLFHYDASYAALAFLRFARLYRDEAIDRSLSGAVAATAAAIRARMAASQRLDGGWGSPQRTAFCLQSCAMAARNGDADVLLFERGLRYLGGHQLADGSWPAEPLYRIPIKQGREGYHQGRALTTAFCAGALHAALTVIAQRDAPE